MLRSLRTNRPYNDKCLEGANRVHFSMRNLGRIPRNNMSIIVKAGKTINWTQPVAGFR